MPLIRHDQEQLEVGAYYVNVRTGTMVEIMEVDLSGNCRVLDAAAELDAPWEPLGQAQIASCLWQRVGATEEQLPRAA
jgi:hypothetical protein